MSVFGTALSLAAQAVHQLEHRRVLRQHEADDLAQADAVQMVDKCLSAPDTIRFDIFDAISENSRRWRDTSHPKDVLGWKPTGSSDRFDPNTLAV